MYQQTRMMAKTFPKLASIYEEYDTRPVVWTIVAFRCLPKEADLGSFMLLEEMEKSLTASHNRFSSRTAALRRSAIHAQGADAGASEDGHMGAWRFRAKNELWYCTVVPLEALRTFWAEEERRHVARDVKSPTGESPVQNRTNMSECGNGPVIQIKEQSMPRLAQSSTSGFGSVLSPRCGWRRRWTGGASCILPTASRDSRQQPVE
jgi:hypothetical protein